MQLLQQKRIFDAGTRNDRLNTNQHAYKPSKNYA